MLSSQKFYIQLLFILAFAFLAEQSTATVHVVTSNADSGPGTLREATLFSSPNDTITFGDTMTVKLDSAIIIFHRLYIFGAGVKYTTIQGKGSDRLFRVFYAGNDTTVFHGIRFTNGNANTLNGGAIEALASIALFDCRIDHCDAANGAGLFALGSNCKILIQNSTIDSCNATGDGGGIYLSGQSKINIINSTISGNRATSEGGGLYALNDNNISVGFYNSTIASNTATAGGGVFLYSLLAQAADTAYSSIFADNGGASADYNAGNMVFGNNNIIENGVSANGFGNQSLDPKLLPLKDNGRCMPTHGLIGSSPAIDAGLNLLLLSHDQRGAPRELDGLEDAVFIADIGAFEYTPYCVVNTNNNGGGSLDDAIVRANAHQGKDYICFDIPGPGIKTINLTSSLANVVDPVIIDGYSQHGSYPAFGEYVAIIRIQITDGNTQPDALVFAGASNDSEVYGLSIMGFSSAAIDVKGVIDSKFQGNHIGVNALGNNGAGNGIGISFSNGANFNLVGGIEDRDRNLISNNAIAAIQINGCNSNLVDGNFIGVLGGGQSSANFNGASSGVIVMNASAENQIGTYNGRGNVISGFSLGNAIEIRDLGTMNNQIHHNFIGLGVDGVTSIQNNNGISVHSHATGTWIRKNVIANNISIAGIHIKDSLTSGTSIEDNIVGLDIDQNPAPNGDGIIITAGAINVNIGTSSIGNIISGNSGDGVKIENGGGGITVFNNLVGVDSSGANPVGNNKSGIFVDALSKPVTIGGVFGSATNIISANAIHGIHLESDNNIVLGNLIGLDADNDTLGNTNAGIFIAGRSNIIGQAFNTRNIISSNGVGIEIFAGDDNNINSNFIGTDSTGTLRKGNLSHGVFIHQGAQSNSVYGDLVNKCIISGNDSAGVYIEGTGTRLNKVEGAFVGTDVSGAVSVPNRAGVAISNQANSNDIGLLTAGKTIISGNDSVGVLISNADSNSVTGCAIGLNSDGNDSVPNTYGVILENGAKNNKIGGILSSQTQNIISGNYETGVVIKGAGTVFNTVHGNTIGTNKAGTDTFPNLKHGVAIRDFAVNNFIGGGLSGLGNLISGNRQAGVAIIGGGTKANRIEGNYIGTDISTTVSFGNGIGVMIQTADSNFIGNAGTFKNIISGNDSSGVLMSLGANNNKVFGNFIGLDSTGTDTLANGGPGVQIKNSFSNVIGDTMFLDKGNIIAANSLAGILIEGAASNTNLVFGNKIGTDIFGTTAMPNKSFGVAIVANANTNFIGSGDTTRSNLISGNLKKGVYTKNSSDNFIIGNLIGTEITGSISLGIQDNGVHLDSGSVKNVVGGNFSSGANNVISGNDTVGVLLTGFGTDSNKIEGNYIGLDKLGLNPVPNMFGVAMFSGPKNNSVGSQNEDATNFIGGNDSISVAIFATGTTNNKIIDNYIGTGKTTTEALGCDFGIYLANGPQNNLVDGNHITDHVYGIILDGIGTDSDTITDNNIGTDTAGIAAQPNMYGLAITNGAKSNQVFHNLISGNDSAGVLIYGSGTDSNEIYRNIIGPDMDITAPIDSQQIGVGIIGGAQNNIIGGTAKNKLNAISGNYGIGVIISGNQTDNNKVFANFIGCDTLASNTPIPNGYGVVIADSAKFNKIGEDITNYPNHISGNDSVGVLISDTLANWNAVSGNFIGTQLNGFGSLPNKIGVQVDSRSSWNLIGDSLNSIGTNIISGNTEFGVSIGGNLNTISGNFIGTDSTGTNQLPNLSAGVYVYDGSFNIIGGNATNRGNIISGNNGNGILVVGSWLTYIRSNLIGVAKDTTPLANSLNGISIIGGLNTIIGGALPAYGNIISSNGINGIQMNGSAGGHTVNANYIGTDTSGTAILGNNGSGIRIDNFMLFGGNIGDSLLTSPQNTIAFNQANGITITGSEDGNGLYRNILYNNGGYGIDLDDNGMDVNDSLDLDNGANQNQNHPVVIYAVKTNDGIGVQGYLKSEASVKNYWLEFFGNYVSNADDEAREYLGGLSVTSNLNGYSSFSEFFNITTNIDIGDSVRGTASLIRNTSELGMQVVVIDEPDAPIGVKDTVYCELDTAKMSYLTAMGVLDSATVKWYTGSIDTSGFLGYDSILPLANVGQTCYYVTQTIANVESPPDTVCIDILPSIDSLIVDSITLANCSGDTSGSVHLTASGGTSPYTYYNVQTGDSIVTAGGALFTGLIAGNYTFTVTDSIGCGTDSVSVVILNDTSGLPTVTISPDDTMSLCQGDCRAIDLDFDGYGGPYYIVYEYDSASLTIQDTTVLAYNDTTVFLCPSTSRTLTIIQVYDVTTGCVGDTVGADVTFLVEPRPEAPTVTGDTNICSGDTALLVASSVNQSDSIAWFDIDSVFIVANDSIFISDLSEGQYQYYAVSFSQSDLNCPSIPLPVSVEVHEPDADAGPDTTICLGLSAQLNASGGSRYKWSPTDGLNNDTIPNPVVSPQATTIYIVTVTDLNRCSATDSVEVVVDDSPECGWHVYNAFSPNNDGDNDVWVIDGIDRFTANRVQIFNRWGDRINEFENYNNTSVVWEGTNKSGKNLPDGTYFYIIEVPELPEKMSGWVQLTR